jgi:hypothetical protein
MTNHRPYDHAKEHRPVRVEQAIYTSLPRGGREGYHVVSRSAGISEADARALASWCPSHGSLIVDEANRASVNVHPLPDGRVVVSRSCEGRPEYSGRGGRQVYTHAIVADPDAIGRGGASPVALYLDAMALGLFRYRPDPGPSLEPAEVGDCHRPPRSPEGQGTPIPPDELDRLRDRLARGDSAELHHPGDRLRFLEALLGVLPADLTASLSVSTSLTPSNARPFALRLVP